MSKEKQIEFEMAEMLEIIENAREVYANDVTDHTENEYIREGLLNAGYRKQSEWVSVDERLPEEDGGYLCYGYWADNGSRCIYIILCCCEKWQSWRDFTVTHWMPLPEDPR